MDKITNNVQFFPAQMTEGEGTAFDDPASLQISSTLE